VTRPEGHAPDYRFPDPARRAAWRRVLSECLVVEDVYPDVARRFQAEGVSRFLEVGGGEGPVSEILGGAGVTAIVLDLNPEPLTRAARPAVRSEMARLPFPDASFAGVAAINCLYFLDDPTVAIREAHRVLEPGGLFVASSPSKFNDPEISHLVEDPTAGFFDSEDAPALVGSVFGEVEVKPWDLVAFRLPERRDVADYLHAFEIPDHEARAEEFALPLTITKRGAQVWARRG
jgi:SAM-dependent methyltransferase